MAKPRVVFLGNSESVFSNRHFAVLAEPWIDVVAVVDTPAATRTSTNPDRGGEIAPFTEIARAEGVPIFEPDDPNTTAMVREFAALCPDVLVAVGYVKLLRPPVLEIPRLVAANFHASLLPAYRGKHPVFWALRNGERYAGLTVHVMDPHIDTGDILYHVRVRTRRRDSVAELYSRIMDRSVALVPRLVSDAAAGRLRPRTQENADASYFSSTTEDDFRLSWSVDGETLRRWICATPGRCWFQACGRPVRVQDAEIERGVFPARVGTIVKVGRGGCVDSGAVKPMSRICAELGLAAGDALR